ncbi:hypothetical protein [Mycolicibacterium sp.]|uniref:hypothetical protein n=1 Tax=Mycolicibacterium sp. TaxID=2320850 RepID=UPI0037C57182
MTASTFVIHGIGNRDPAAFTNAANALAAKIGITAHPVYWGDLGATYDLIAGTVPGATDEIRDAPAESAQVDTIGRFLLTSAEPSGDEVRGDTDVPELILTTASDAFAASDEELRDEPSSESSAIADAIRNNWPDLTWLPLVDDTELQHALGAAIAGPLTDAGTSDGVEVRDEELRALDIAQFVRRRLDELDRVVGAAVNAVAGRLNMHLRTTLLPGITRAVGDILVYQRHRERIHDRLRSTIDAVDPRLGRSADHPVDVLAHSLGGVVAVDMATADDPLWIRTLVTFGSQPSFFHVCDPRGGQIAPYSGLPVTLPRSIQTWTNLWEPLDPLAFAAAPIFALHDGSAPSDAEIAHLASAGLWTHSGYWTLDDVARRARTALSSP